MRKTIKRRCMDCDFLGVDVENNVFLILSREICGYGGGIAYEVIPIPELTIR